MVGAGIMGAVKTESGHDALMLKKLQHAQNILEGLALEDFDKIKTGGKELLIISQEAQWRKIQTPKYNQLSVEFRSAVDKLVAMAEAKNLDGSTLQFMQVTMSCVECHKLVRDSQKVAGAH